MKKKNFIAYLLAILTIVFSGAIFSACGEKTVKEIYLKEGTYAVEVAHNGTYSYDDIIVIAKLSNGEEMELERDDWDITTPLDTSVVGEQEFVITFGTYEAKGKVNVDKTMQSISYKSGLANRIKYGTSVDVSNLVITLNYSNHDSSDLSYSNANGQITVTLQSTDLGNTNYKISYRGKEVLVPVEIYEEVESIEIRPVDVTDRTTGYVLLNETLDTSKFIVVAVKTKNEETLLPAQYTFDAVDTTTLGEKDLVAHYGDFTDTIKIHVIESWADAPGLEVESISIVAGSVSQTVKQDETLDISRLQLSVVYTNKLKATIDYADHLEEGDEKITVTPFDTSTVGTKTLEVFYKGKKAELPITVERVLVSIEIKSSSVASQVYVGDQLDTSNLTIIAHYKDGGATQEITSGFEILQNVVTTEEGTQTLIVAYQGKQASFTVTVLKTYTITGFNDPKFVTDYNSNKALKNQFTKTGSDGVKGFEIINRTYKVGNNNNFIYSPILSVRTKDGKNENLTEYKAKISVYIYDNEQSQYVLLDDNQSEYVLVDNKLHTFLFTQNSVGNKFLVKILPFSMTASEQELVTEKSLEFEVIDGYNVYAAKDLSVIDNVNSNGKWADIKSANGIDVNLNVKSVILHNNISISDSDIPQVHFWKEGDKGIAAGDSDYNRVLNSLKDDRSEQLGFIYLRRMNSGETFTIEGNYFTLSAQNLSKIVREDNQTESDKIMGEDEALTIHTSLFGFFGQTTNAEKSKAVINNLSMFGNTQKSDNTSNSGGVMAIKTRYTNIDLDNVLSQCWFISIMFEGSDAYADDCVQNIRNVNAFDAYNTLLYLYGVRNVNIENSHLIGAGGPVMICDHVGNNKTTGAGGHITNVTTTNSVLESYVAGTEGWFATYEGSGALASQIKAFSPLFENMGKTLCDSKGEKINLVAVYKSSEVEGLSNSTIRGTYTITGASSNLDISSESKLLEFAYKTGLAVQVKTNVWTNLKNGALKQGLTEEQATAYADQNVYAQTMNYLNSSDGASVKAQLLAGVKQFASNGMFMQTDSGAVAFPGTDGGWYKDSKYNFDGTPDQAELDATNENIFVYLPNGMCAVLGIYSK